MREKFLGIQRRSADEETSPAAEQSSAEKDIEDNLDWVRHHPVVVISMLGAFLEEARVRQGDESPQSWSSDGQGLFPAPTPFHFFLVRPEYACSHREIRNAPNEAVDVSIRPSPRILPSCVHVQSIA